MKIVSNEVLDQLTEKAKGSPRLRSNWNLHPRHEDPIQRFFNGMEPGTYVRPHFHEAENAWEGFVILRGSAAVVTFSDSGVLTQREIISASGPIYGLELPPNIWHAVAAIEPGTVLFEFKPGPYNPTSDKNFATWAPEEGHERCSEFELWYREGAIGTTNTL